MRVYMITGSVLGHPHDKCLQFVASQAEAASALRNYKKLPAVFSNLAVTPEDIPTNKEGLLRWLNQYTLDDDKKSNVGLEET
jgi:hypothetical protein